MYIFCNSVEEIIFVIRRGSIIIFRSYIIWQAVGALALCNTRTHPPAHTHTDTLAPHIISDKIHNKIQPQINYALERRRSPSSSSSLGPVTGQVCACAPVCVCVCVLNWWQSNTQIQLQMRKHTHAHMASQTNKEDK